MISIVLPFYNRYDLVHKRLYEFWTYLPKDDLEIILINDASTEERDYEGNIGWWQKKVSPPLPIRYHVNPKNLGFGGSMNLGAEHAKGDVLVFFSDDVIVSGNFISELLPLLQNDGNLLVGNQSIDWAAGWNEFDIDGKHIVIPYLAGYFLACTKATWKKLGGFDPLYGRFDYEDVDLSTTALSLGYNLVVLNSKYLQHLGGVSIASLNVDRMNMTRRNRELYIAKWEHDLLGIYNSLRMV